MREMQEKVYQARDAQYLLLKAPPASGKSRALMFIALDKLEHQGLKKVIVAVPEKSIGGSFGTTKLKQFGFLQIGSQTMNTIFALQGWTEVKAKCKHSKTF